MITIKHLEGNILAVIVSEALKAEDINQIVPEVDQAIKKNGHIRLFVDATNFNGWADVGAFERHMDFVKTHQDKIERAAIIAGHAWHHWVAGMIRLFVHPQIHVYDKNQESEARQWIAK